MGRTGSDPLGGDKANGGPEPLYLETLKLRISQWRASRSRRRSVLCGSLEGEGEMMPVMALQASSFVLQMSSCARSKLWQHALWLFEHMHHARLRRNVVSYSAAISACEKGAQWPLALNLFESMRACGVRPNVITFNTAISACEKGGQGKAALTMFEAMPQAKLQPDVISYNATISACGKVVNGRRQ